MIFINTIPQIGIPYGVYFDILEGMKPVFYTNLFAQRKTIETLIKESRTDNDFYLFLFFGIFVTTLGLHLNNAVVVIGAMLIAPMLFPILALGMGVVTSNRESIVRSLKNLSKSVILGVILSSITSFFFSDADVTELMSSASDPNALYLLVAFLSGIIASYAWAKQTLSSTLPGIAITVSLVPPLSVIGISIAQFSRDLFTGSLLLFLMNLVGIVIASIIVFSLYGFSRMRHFEEQEIKKETLEAQHHGTPIATE